MAILPKGENIVLSNAKHNFYTVRKCMDFECGLDLLESEKHGKVFSLNPIKEVGFWKGLRVLFGQTGILECV